MENLLLWMGRAAALGGALVCAGAIVARLTGLYHVGAFQIGTLLQIGMMALLIACVCLLVVLTNRSRR